jgi:ABC-2 type transport system permease protein
MTVTLPAVASVREAGGTFASDLRGIRVVWRRELIRFSRDRTRMITSLIQPVLFLFVLGTGLSTIARPTAGVSFKTFMFPGIIGMTVLFTAVFSAMSIVWDREFGFLREMLVAPVKRWSIVLGKCFGGMTVATVQGVIFLCLAGAVGVPYAPVMLIELVGEMALMAFALTAFGILLASRIQQMQSFQVVTQFFVMPMFFLSGAMFPLSGLPSWLTALTKIDPLSYAVDPLRRAVFNQLHVSPAALRALDPGISWDGWRLPVPLELGIVAAMAALLLGAAMVAFSRTD